MIKTLLAQGKQYRTACILAPVFTAGETVMEVLIPFVTASIIDRGIEAGDIRQVYLYGGIMLVMAFFSLTFGVLAGRYAAKASSGLACGLRYGMYERIQTFAFSNIDKYSTAGLVTRMTTDVTNVQNACQMILRIAVRAPLMLICSLGMCFVIHKRLSMIFLAAIVILAAALCFIMLRASKLFQEVFRRYDSLNSSVQENVSAIRVVKSFVREEYENRKFQKAADRLYTLFVKAESILAWNNPVMMLVIYGCIIAVSWSGAHFIAAGELSTGNLTSLFSYIMSILMSLMMLSMVFVMVTMSAASGRRIAEVLNEVPDMTDPARPETTVADGSIDFNHVDFSYKHGSGEKTLRDIDLQICFRGDHRHYRRDRLRQVQPGQSDQPPVRCGQRAASVSAVRTFAPMIWTHCGIRWPSCSRKMCCSPARSWTICAGAERTPRRKNAPRPAAWPVPMSLSSGSRMDTTPGSSRAAAMSPAARSSVCVLPAPC